MKLENLGLSVKRLLWRDDGYYIFVSFIRLPAHASLIVWSAGAFAQAFLN